MPDIFHPKANPKSQSLCLGEKFVWVPSKKVRVSWAGQMSLELVRSRAAGPRLTKGRVSLPGWVSVVQLPLVDFWSSVQKRSSLWFEGVPASLCQSSKTELREKKGKGNNFFFLYDSSFKTFFRTNNSSGLSRNNPVQQIQQFRDNRLEFSTVTGIQQVGLPCYLWEAFCCTSKPDYHIC